MARGKRQLTTAASDGDIEALKLSLQNGADIDYQDVGGTALMWAARGGYLEICSLLIDRGCKIDITDDYGETALMCATEGGHLEICRLLIDRGCKIDITADDGYTALHYAAGRGYLQITRCLVEQGGASPLIKSHKGKTPYDLAAKEEKGQYKEVMEYLQELSNPILTKLRQLNRNEFQDLVALGTFASYENRVYLSGPCNIGKSSLASILIGEEIPKTWFSTDGLIIHFGRNGIDLQQRKMIPLEKSSGDVLAKLLLGNPELKKQPSLQDESIEKNPGDPKSNVKTKGNQLNLSNVNLRPSNQEHMSSKSNQETSKDFKEQPIHTANSIQDDLLVKIKKGTNIMNIAPSDLVDFGGQKSFDMTHQLFIQHRGTFILMFDGRKGLYTELEEYPQGDVTAASILEHWINSVLTYCNKTEDKMPRILFAATHSDSFSEVHREDQTLTKIANVGLQDEPSDDVINSLTEKQLIGDCIVHLGIELKLSINSIKATIKNNPRDVYGQFHDLLIKWKSGQVKPTIYRLMVALKNVKASDGLAYVMKTYDVEPNINASLEQEKKQFDPSLSDLRDILDQMMTKLVISVDDRRSIEQNTDQENTMLDIVIKRGEPNKSMCIDVLMQNTGYEDLAEKLMSDSSSSVPPPYKTELQDVPDYKIRLQKNYLEIIKTLNHDQ